MNRLEALRSFKEALRREGIEEYDAEAQIALSAFLGIELFELMLDKAVPEDIENRIADAVKRRAEGEPMAYCSMGIISTEIEQHLQNTLTTLA